LGPFFKLIYERPHSFDGGGNFNAAFKPHACKIPPSRRIPKVLYIIVQSNELAS
jgi:hypothetical protein